MGSCPSPVFTIAPKWKKTHKIQRFLGIIRDGIYLERVYNWEKKINFQKHLDHLCIQLPCFPLLVLFPVSLCSWTPLLVSWFHTPSLGKSLLCERNLGISCLWNSLNLSYERSYKAILFWIFFLPLLKFSLFSLSLWEQWRIIVGATKCIPKSELPEEPEENSVTNNRLWTHPSDLTIALSASTPLYPPGRIIHVVHNHPAEQCW